MVKLASRDFPFYPYSCVALSGLLGWGLAAGLVGLADALFRSHSLRGISGALLYLGCLARGGFLLGLVTGLILIRLRPHDAAR